jgi:protein-tyrosine phosphatase
MNGSQPTRIEGALLTELRRVPHRVLHGFRRRRAIKALRGRPRPTCLLVVCRGNICRSPFAAALLHRALSRFGVRVDSVGFTAGRPSPPDAVAAAARHDVDLCDHRSQLATTERVRMADLIVVMDHRQRREICERFGRDVRDVLLLGDLDPQPNESRTIRDPVKEPRAVFEQTYARIVRCARELARAVTAARA